MQIQEVIGNEVTYSWQPTMRNMITKYLLQVVGRLSLLSEVVDAILKEKPQKVIALFPLKNSNARLFYAQKSTESSWSKRELRRQIERKAFERSEIANTQIPQDTNSYSDTI